MKMSSLRKTDTTRLELHNQRLNQRAAALLALDCYNMMRFIRIGSFQNKFIEIKNSY